MSHELTLRLIDTHAGGDVSRIVIGGIDPLPGDTVRQQMEYLENDADGLRRLLLDEPYGIPEMSVDLIVPATDPKASMGYIIMEVMGYPIYSGSNTICTATALLESGLIPKQEGRQRFMLESPAGLVQIEALVEKGVVEAITCGGLPSYIDTHRARIHVPEVGDVTYSIAYSGGFYAWWMPRSWASRSSGRRSGRWPNAPTASSRRSRPAAASPTTPWAMWGRCPSCTSWARWNRSPTTSTVRVPPPTFTRE
ncbi:hypothetical protein Q427_03685 [Halomonas sp. BC04]|nr:hypothetical protein Q427_03685 [Halomonas sp. BC04]